MNCIDLLIIGNDTVINGMFIGCLPITSLCLSTLECFYNETCLNQIQQALSLQTLSVNVLDSLQSSHYSVKTTLNYIIDNLMLENWTFEINYTAYSNACNFEKCSYSMMIAAGDGVVVLCIWVQRSEGSIPSPGMAVYHRFSHVWYRKRR